MSSNASQVGVQMQIGVNGAAEKKANCMQHKREQKQWATTGSQCISNWSLRKADHENIRCLLARMTM